MFEMLYGYPPFTARSRQITRNKIIQWRTNLRFPSQPPISSQAQDFIESLICDRASRLGSRGAPVRSRPPSFCLPATSARPSGGPLDNSLSGPSQAMQDGAKQLRAHPWFQSFVFAAILSLYPSASTDRVIKCSCESILGVQKSTSAPFICRNLRLFPTYKTKLTLDILKMRSMPILWDQPEI